MRIWLLGIATGLVLQSTAIAQQVLDDSAGRLAPASLSAAMTAVANELRDPTSAQFRNLRPGKTNDAWVCGEVNGTNAYGGYAGFSPFRYSPNLGVVVWSNSDDEMQRVTEAMEAFGCFDEFGTYLP